MQQPMLGRAKSLLAIARNEGLTTEITHTRNRNRARSLLLAIAVRKLPCPRALPIALTPMLNTQ